MRNTRAAAHSARLGRAAERIWSEGRVNPVDWIVGTTLGAFATTDRVTWRTADSAWTAELRRSRNGRRWYLALFHSGLYCGRYDPATGWHAAGSRSRVRQLRSLSLSLPSAA
jgi:hypothetical protein